MNCSDGHTESESPNVAFRLRQQESVAEGLRRLAAKQLRSGADELQRPNGLQDEAVHEARKSVKKVRAILHLVEEDHGQGLSDSKELLRGVNRRLSRLRDAVATLEVLKKIRQTSPDVLSEHTVARVRRVLSSRKQAAVTAARRDHFREKALMSIRTLQKAVAWWRPRHRGFGALAAGMRKTHRRGRKAMKRALKRQRAADFHEWRKEIKTLWYELRLLENCGGDIQKDIRTLDRAETMLGDEHNTVLLCEQLARDGASLPAADLDGLRRAADRYQRDLRRRAFASARHIYSLASDDYVRRIKSAWKHWHRATPSHPGQKQPRGAALASHSPSRAGIALG
jgi:CHAD domain-containing protein